MKLENLNPAKRNTKFTVNGNVYWIGHGGFIDDGDGNPTDVPEVDAKKLVQGRAWRELGWDPKDPKYAKRVMPAATGKGIGRRPRTVDELKWDQGIRPKTVDELGGQAVAVATKDGKPTGEELVENRAPSTEEIQKAYEKDVVAAAASSQGRDIKINGKVVAKSHGQEETGFLSDMGEPVSGDDSTRVIESATDTDVEEIEEEKEIEEETAEDEDIEEAEEEIEAYEDKEDKEDEEDEEDEANGDEWPDPTPRMTLTYLREMADAYEVKYNKNSNKKRLIKDITAAMYPEA